MKPNELLDLNLPTLQAVIEGYQDHLFDLKCLSVYQGFWAGYYSNSKKPRSLSSVLTKLLTEHQKQKKQKNTKRAISKPEVNVDKFIERERRFKYKLKRGDTGG